MSASALVLNKGQLETAILADVVTQFVNFRTSTPRRELLIKYRGLPAVDVIMDLVGRNWIRRKDPSAEEQYLPLAVAFEFCGRPELREQAKQALTIVLHALQAMYVGEPAGKMCSFGDLRNHLHQLFAGRSFDDETLRLGLYLPQDFGVFGGLTMNPERPNEIAQFKVAERALTLGNPEDEWETMMARYKPRPVASATLPQRAPAAPQVSAETDWERIKPLGGGGQSDVFLVRSPERVLERTSSLQKIRTALDGDKRAELAEAVWSYARPDADAELGALKVFKIPPEGATLSPLPGSPQYEAVERLKNEIAVLQQGRRGLPKLLASNLEKRWIVTEYFPLGSLDRHPLKYEGNSALALTAFRSLVETVASLHKDGYVHRDIKPPNVFINRDDQLALGDFGIVYLPNAIERVTMLDERVGPRDYMPQWANLGVRHENVEPCFDVYMLGKLLWSMTDGRRLLPREYHHNPEFDLTKTFPDDPDVFLVNRILDKCVVEHSEQCLPGAQELLLVVDEALAVIKRGGHLLRQYVPKPCRICGKGFYQPEPLQPGRSDGMLRLWMSGGALDITSLAIRVLTCSYCGHVQFFKQGHEVE